MEDAPAIQRALSTSSARAPRTPMPIGIRSGGLYKPVAAARAGHPFPHRVTAIRSGDDRRPEHGHACSICRAPTFTPGYFLRWRQRPSRQRCPASFGDVGWEATSTGITVGPLWTLDCNDAVNHPDAVRPRRPGPVTGGRYPLGGEEPSQTISSLVRVGPLRAGPSPICRESSPDAARDRQRLRPEHPVCGGPVSSPPPWVDGSWHLVGYGHTWLLNGSTNPCMQDVVTAYFLCGPRSPAKGTRRQRLSTDLPRPLGRARLLRRDPDRGPPAGPGLDWR